MKFNLFGKPKETTKDIQLYCQNLRCNYPLISKEESPVEIKGSILHIGCVSSYMWNESPKPVGMTDIHPISYSQACKLAEEGKINFSQLEKTSIGGMGQ